MEKSEQLFRSIYEQYLPTLRICARKYGVSENDVEDVVQDTFFAYYQKYPLTWNDSQIKSMLGTIVRNRSIDYVRKRSRHPLILYDPQHMEQTEGVLDRLIAQDSLSILVQDEKYRLVWDGIKSMNKQWAQVIILHIVYDYPISEVSRILETTDAACRTRLSRGRKYLLKYVRKHDQ
ncbi:MAG: RNA polymerase sigma factor [Lachnospiraceae bacterium]